MKSKIIILLIISLLLLGSCSIFEKEEEHPYKGITETQLLMVDGELVTDIISEDTDDWTVKNINTDYNQLPSEYKIGPAYPNPAIDTTFIILALPQQDSVYFYIKNENGKVVKTLVNRTLSAGFYHIYWDIDDGTKPGMYRCYYSIGYDYSNNIITGYGDIKVKK